MPNHAMQVLPFAQYYKRAGFSLKKICQYATARGFTDVLVANEDRKSVNGLLLIHLPGGPTAHFRLSKLVLSKDIKVHWILLPPNYARHVSFEPEQSAQRATGLRVHVALPVAFEAEPEPFLPAGARAGNVAQAGAHTLRLRHAAGPPHLARLRDAVCAGTSSANSSCFSAVKHLQNKLPTAGPPQMRDAGCAPCVDLPHFASISSEQI